jgi:hypothetical protein
MNKTRNVLLITTLLIFCFFNNHKTYFKIQTSSENFSQNYNDLYSAAFQGKIEDIQNALRCGISVNIQDDKGQTLLHHAAKSDSANRQEIIRYLIENGARVDIQDIKGICPLNGLDADSLQDILDNVTINTHEMFKADVSFLFADIKYDKNLKILEFGEGKNGGYRSFDAIFKTGRIWESFWECLSKFGLPIWYVGPKPSSDPINKIGITLGEKLSWGTFNKIRGKAFLYLSQLESDPSFKALSEKKHDFNPYNLSSYKGIVVFKYRDDREYSKLKSLEKFKKNNPEFLVLDESSRPYAANKELTNMLFQDLDLLKYRPKCKIYSKEYGPNLANKIKGDFQCNYYIIKPINSGMSNGVIMTSSDELGNVLRRILKKRPGPKKIGATFNYRPTDTLTYSYWDGDKNKEFIVEEYVTSKDIIVKGKKYDPTMRVVFVIHNDQGVITINFLESWWKIPPFALKDKVSLTERHVSKYRPDLKALPASELKVDPADMILIKSILREMLPKIYIKMLKVNKEIFNKN